VPQVGSPNQSTAMHVLRGQFNRRGEEIEAKSLKEMPGVFGQQGAITGSRTVKVVPSPFVLVTSIVP
jgi:hypothetical protein